jgi:DNA integrity scanning protein DisA with diadenylate cyclase activity
MLKKVTPGELELLRKELEVYEIRLDGVIEVFPGFMEYLASALYAPPHEDEAPSWGMLFLESIPDSATEMIDEYIPTFSDGESTFGLQLRDDPQIRTAAFDHVLLDSQILQLCQSTHEAAIVRNENRLTIFHNGKIHICEQRIWRTLGDLTSAMQKILTHYPGLPHDQFTSILGFAYYELSLRKIGATLVYWLKPEYNTSSTIKDAFQLNFNSPSHQKMVRQYIAFNDGAVIINCENRVLGGQVHLLYSQKSKELIESYPGTRHTSACRFSYDQPDALVVTVSKDGPVSVFSDGCNIATLDYSSVQPNEELLEIAREFRKESGFEETYQKSCSSCGKNYHITLLKFKGWSKENSVKCYICGNELEKTECFKIDSVLLKSVG